MEYTAAQTQQPGTHAALRGAGLTRDRLNLPSFPADFLPW